MVKYLPLATMLAAVVGAGYLSMYRLDTVEERLERVEEALETKASVDDLRGIKNALGAVQLDVAVICAEIVKQGGGNPLTVCRTARGLDR